ncbi:inositol monophosphatase family protein [Luteipulveratus flavus]|uniref:Inositol-1-monophosphatase n=1 Tax=Luteipulveratus flavus TaxID=3031728 RepID=A0ABT6CAA9_9MICO|nr:inositol monophosphatase family protein [Luteipulveratus sp. YIM 133296]MDF8265835.1 inositol monophosphatase family protein [Luteipulveratus sp. YIM 133296]
MATPHEPSLSAADLGTLETMAADLAREAGRLIVDERPSGLGVAATKSSRTDVVTVMDTRSEDLLRERIAARRPDDGILGEEGDSIEGSSGITWVLDPIDGTVNYLYDIPQYAVSVAACVGDTSTPGAWRPIAGAVYHPVLGEMFHARAGSGAFLRAPSGVHALAVSNVTDLDDALLGTGFGYDADKRGRQGELVARVLPRVRDIRRAGSAALDLCAVAAGRLDVYYESGLNPWDLAAGRLVVEEAGGVVVGPGGAAPTDVLVVAGPTALVTRVQQLIE